MEFISVSGYGWSGSSAYISLLKEFRDFDCIDKEFRMIKDPFGLLDLQSSIVDNWEFVRHDVAIRDFLWFCHLLGREESLFGRFGSGYDDLLNTDIVKEAEEYIERLTSFSYIGDSVVHRYRMNQIGLFYRRILSKFGFYNNTGVMRISRPSKEEFIHETKIFLSRIFKNYINNNNIKYVLLDQGIPVSNIEKSSMYFNSIKTIVVDRDPRDIYISLVKRRKLLGFDLSEKDDAKKYVHWHKTLRGQNKSSKALYVDFEDLVLNYEALLRLNE